ncbi:MAG: hypothetical protein ACTHMM_11910 [Agriterribacter sp.]
METQNITHHEEALAAVGKYIKHSNARGQTARVVYDFLKEASSFNYTEGPADLRVYLETLLETLTIPEVASYLPSQNSGLSYGFVLMRIINFLRELEDKDVRDELRFIDIRRRPIGPEEAAVICKEYEDKLAAITESVSDKQ